MAKGRKQDAKESLLWLRGPGLSTDKEYEELCEANAKREEGRESFAKALHEPCVWKPFLILLAFFALQQMSGIYIILFYTVKLLEYIGIDLNEYSASVGIGVIRLFASIAGAGLANCFGRKVLAFISGLGMAISAVGVALSYRFVPFPQLCMHAHTSASVTDLDASTLRPFRHCWLSSRLDFIVHRFILASIELHPSNRSNFLCV